MKKPSIVWIYVRLGIAFCVIVMSLVLQVTYAPPDTTYFHTCISNASFHVSCCAAMMENYGKPGYDNDAWNRHMAAVIKWDENAGKELERLYGKKIKTDNENIFKKEQR